MLAKILWLLAFALVTIKAEEMNLTPQDVCLIVPGGSTILRPNSCSNWVKCASQPGAPDYEEGACVYGLYFDKEHGVCQSKDDMSCPFETQAQKAPCADKKDGTFLPDIDNCNGYIYCEKGKEIRSKCPSDFVFHPKKLECVYPTQYTCPAKTEQKSADPICYLVRANLNFADQHDCVKYHKCNNQSRVQSFQCQEGLAFDHVLGQCINQANATCHPASKRPEPINTMCGTKDKPFVGYLPDDDSCSGYYVCSKQAKNEPDRHPKHMRCQKGFFFDEKTWSCRDRVNVNCRLDRCEGMGNKYVNVVGDCTAYARCSNDVTVDHGYCPSSYYFDERTQGCTPQKITYAACQPSYSNANQTKTQ